MTTPDHSEFIDQAVAGIASAIGGHKLICPGPVEKFATFAPKEGSALLEYRCMTCNEPLATIRCYAVEKTC